MENYARIIYPIGYAFETEVAGIKVDLKTRIYVHMLAVYMTQEIELDGLCVIPFDECEYGVWPAPPYL